MRWIENTTITALENLSGSQYCAIAINDGKVANNGAEASGILQNKPISGDHASIAYVGESRYRAGLAVTKGDRLSVTTSGYFISANSGSTVIGKALDTVGSGSIGQGIFSFAAGDTISEEHGLVFTAGEAIEDSGIAIGSGHLVLEAATSMLGVSQGAVASAVAGRMTVDGIAEVRVGGGDINQGVSLVPTGSGYFVGQAGSGDYAYAVLLEDTTSGTLGAARLGHHVVN